MTLDLADVFQQPAPTVTAVKATVANTPAGDDLYVVVESFDGARQHWGPCAWSPPMELPQEGDDCLLVLDEHHAPYVMLLSPIETSGRDDVTWPAMCSRSFGFLRDQMRTYVRGTRMASIKPTTDYPYGYLGPVSGTFGLSEQFGTWAIPQEPVSGGAAGGTMHIDGPLDADGEVPDGYRNNVKGHLNVPMVTGDTIRVWKQDESGQLYLQTPTTTVAANGTWNVSLTAVPNNQFGYWRFQLWRSGAQVGDLCPSNNPPTPGAPAGGQTYSDLRVDHYVLADMPYLMASGNANADGTFSIASSGHGFKRFQLMRKSTGALLADYTTLFGNIRSYLPYPGEDGYGTNFVDRNYSYDSSVAVLAALALGEWETARQLVRGMMQMFTPQTPAWTGAHPGGFSWSCMQTTPGFTYWDPVYRTGVHAWCTYALLCYMDSCPLDTTVDYATAARQALAYADTLYVTSGGNAGLYTGGSGRYTSSGDYDPTYVLPWSGTEHQMDLWHMWDKAHKVLGDAAFASKRDALGARIIDAFWIPSKNRMAEGIDQNGVQDTADPLDCHTWMTVFLHKFGRDDLGEKIMSTASLAPLYNERAGARGYAAYYPGPEGGYPGAVPTVWSEGTFGAALAFLALGDDAAWRHTIEGVMPLQMTDGGYRYVSDEDVVYEMTTSRSCIGSSWSILACAGLWGNESVKDR